MQNKNSIWSAFYDPEKPSFTKMNNSYFVCDVAPMKLRVYCMHLLLQRRKKAS